MLLKSKPKPRTCGTTMPCEKIDCQWLPICAGCHMGTCDMQSCGGTCNMCGGGPAIMGKKECINVCCKSPLAKPVMAELSIADHNPELSRKLFPGLSDRAIHINQGMLPGHKGDLYLPDNDSVGVNLRRIWSVRGWYTKDVRDYYQIPKGKKVILCTNTHDDFLDDCWDHRIFDFDFSSIGIDYWQPLEYSVYGGDSSLANLRAILRTLYAMEKSQSQFFPLQGHDFVGDKIQDRIISAATHLQSAFYNAQFLTLADLKDIIFPIKQFAVPLRSIIFSGVTTPVAVYNLQLGLHPIACYFISTTPWLYALKGRKYGTDGKVYKTKLSKSEVLIQNQMNYNTMIRDAVSAAYKKLGIG